MAAGQMTAEQQAMLALSGELDATKNQMMEITRRFDGLQQAHTQLASESDRLFRAKAAEIAALEQLPPKFVRQKTDFELLDIKVNEAR